MRAPLSNVLVKCKSADDYTIWKLLLNKVDSSKVSYEMIISLPQIETIDIGHKSLLFKGRLYSESAMHFSNL